MYKKNKGEIQILKFKRFASDNFTLLIISTFNLGIYSKKGTDSLELRWIIPVLQINHFLTVKGLIICHVLFIHPSYNLRSKN